jgi:hypothetical protein
MSSDDVMDWSKSPTSWAAVFEGEAELPIPALANRSSHKDGKDASSSLKLLKWLPVHNASLYDTSRHHSSTSLTALKRLLNLPMLKLRW